MMSVKDVVVCFVLCFCISSCISSWLQHNSVVRLL